MRIVFGDEKLSGIETGGLGLTRLPIAAIASARRKLTVLRAATDDRALKNWRSLKYEQLHGSREGQRAIRVSEGFRMVFELNDKTEPQTATILMIEDMH